MTYETYNFGQDTLTKKIIRSVIPSSLKKDKLGKPQLLGSGNLKQLITWFNKKTKPDDPILASFQLSPTILTWTNRPIILHPKFELTSVRNKFREFISCLYNKTEKDFWELTKKWKAKYFIYQPFLLLDITNESYRYYANCDKLKKSSLIFKFHFEPEKLKYFKLVYQNESFRIYECCPENKSIHISYDAIYDLKLYQYKDNEYFDNKYIVEFVNKLMTQREYETSAVNFMAQKKFENATQQFKKALMIDIPNKSVYLNFASMYAEMKNYDMAIKILKNTIEIDPYYEEAYVNLSAYCFFAKKNDILFISEQYYPKNSDFFNNIGSHCCPN